MKIGIKTFIAIKVIVMRNGRIIIVRIIITIKIHAWSRLQTITNIINIMTYSWRRAPT